MQFEHIIPNFLSRHTREWIDATPELIPTAEEGFSTTVMADVSGYSALTATLAERGPHGAELLGKTMKGYLDKVSVKLIPESLVRSTNDCCYRSFKWSYFTVVTLSNLLVCHLAYAAQILPI